MFAHLFVSLARPITRFAGAAALASTVACGGSVYEPNWEAIETAQSPGLVAAPSASPSPEPIEPAPFDHCDALCVQILERQADCLDDCAVDCRPFESQAACERFCMNEIVP